MEIPFFNPIDQHLFEQRIIQVSGPVSSRLAYKVNRTLLAMEKADKNKPICLFIDSPGGEINSGFSIFDTARFVNPKVYTLVSGLAASMGSLIALCAPKERRMALPNSKFLIHQPLISGMIQGQATDLEIHARDILKVREKINRLYSQETGRSYDEICKLTDRDYWMDAKDAQDLGLISRVIQKHTEIYG